MKSPGMIGWPGNFPGGPPDRRRLSAWLQQKLFERRIVLVTGWLDAAVAGEAAAALMAVDAAGDEPIELHLDSHAGALEAAFVLIDTLDGLHATVRAHCRGQIGGSALGVLAAGDHRSAAPHARFRLAQPTTHFSGTPDRSSRAVSKSAEGWIGIPAGYDHGDRSVWLAWLAESAGRFVDLVKDTPTEWLTRRIEMIDTPGSTLAGWRILMMMLEHEVHHRSQIDAYAGLQGWPVPDIFDRSTEAVAARESEQRARYR